MAGTSMLRCNSVSCAEPRRAKWGVLGWPRGVLKAMKQYHSVDSTVCAFRHSNLRGVLLHDMPDYFFCYSLAPNGASSANTPEQSAVRDTSFC